MGHVFADIQFSNPRKSIFVLGKARFWERYAGQLNERQSRMVSRVFAEGTKGFVKNLILDYPRAAIGFLAAVEARAIDAGARRVPLREEQLMARLGERCRRNTALSTPTRKPCCAGRNGC